MSDQGLDHHIDNYQPVAVSPEKLARNKAALKAYLGAVHDTDLDAIDALMTDDVVVEIPFNESGKTDQASYRIYRGKAEVRAFWAEAFKAEGELHGMSETDVTMTGDGSRVFMEFRGHLTMQSGKEYRNRYVMRVDLVDGKVSRCKEYYNPIQSAYAFGRLVASKHLLESL